MPPPWLRRSGLNRQIAFGLLIWAAEVDGHPSAHKHQHHRLLPELEEKTTGGLYDFTGDNDPVVANKDVSTDNKVNLVVQQHWVFSLQEKATALRFSPVSAHVITIHKHGEVRLYDSVDVDGEDYKTILNIEDKVYSADDHGMVGFAFDPQYGMDGNQYAYLFYMSQPGPAHAVSETTFPNPAVGATRPLDWGDNNCRLETNCEKLSVLTRLVIDLAAKTAKEDAVLLVDQCGGSASHGVGAINFASTEEMIIMYGEHAQYALFDFGMPAKDACYDPAKLPGQGCFRAQRDDFIHGKGIRIAPESYRNSGGYAVDQPLVQGVDYTVFGKGFRNPFRSFIAADDVLWVTDVGSGDEPQTERIYRVDLKQDWAAAPFNAGWPCVQGTPFDGIGAELERQQWLIDNDRLEICQAVYDALDNPSDPVLSAAYNPPLFTYREGALDPTAPAYANKDGESITGAYITDSPSIPEQYRGVLFFMDFTKQGLWYFPNAPATGAPNFAAPPALVLANVGPVDITEDPATRFLYVTDFMYQRTVRVYSAALSGTVPTRPPAVLAERDPVRAAVTCHDAYAFPELRWEMRAEGVRTAQLDLRVSTYSNAHGDFQTRTFNDLLPGPLMRMEPCGEYRVTLNNRMQGYEPPFPEAPFNSYRDPLRTNLHTHGLHVSGSEGGDDVMVVIEPGESHTFTYRIPCDHSGGLHWYHPHHHGSTTLQAGAGAAGLLLVEDNPWLEDGMPEALAGMRQAFLQIQQLDPNITANVAAASQDPIYATTMDLSGAAGPAAHYLVNGCDAFEMAVTQGQWTRLRMLHHAHAANVKLRFVNGLGMPAGCTLGLLALDGVYLNSVPRILTDNVLLLSIASRVDVAARCDVPRPVLMQVSPLGVDAYNTIGTIHVKPSDQPREPDLLAWVPCRPHYLADLQHAVPTQSADVELRGDVNGALLTTDYTPLFNFELDSVNEFVMVNLQEHPAHLHINHVQLQGAPTSFADVPGWFQPGDWYDTVSHPLPVTTRFVTDRFSGAMMLHCHVYAHSDNGVAAMMVITGEGADADASPRFMQSGTCPLAIPTAGKVGIGLEGKMEAEDFDEGGPGIAYMDTTDENMGGNMYRGDAAVDIEACGVCSMTTNTGYDINFNEKGEWLKYTIEDTAYYTPAITISGPLPDPPAPPAPLVPPPLPPKAPPVIAKAQGPPARLLLKGSTAQRKLPPGDGLPAVPPVDDPAAPAAPPVVPGKPAKPVKPAKPAPLAVQMYVAVTPGACFEAADPVCADGAPIATPGTVDYVTYAAFPSPKNLLLYKGAACVKLCVATGGFNIDLFTLAPALDVPPPPTGPVNGAPAALPGMIAATAFDLGTNAMVNGVLVPKPPKSSSYGVQVMPGPPSMRADAAPVSTAECEACPGGFAIRGLAEGEFLSYSATLPTAGKYVLGANVGSGSPLPKGNRIVVVAGVGQCIARAAPYKCQPALERRASVALDQAFATTGGIRVFQMTMGEPVTLPAGDICLQVCSLGAPFSLSEIGVWPVYDPVKVTIPGTIEAENFDIGTMGVTCFDTTPDNNGGNVGYRPDAPEVDVEVGNADDKIMSNNADINWVAAGEWWRYTVTAHAPRAAYTAALSVARAAPTPDPGAMALVLTVPGACGESQPLNCEAAYKYGKRATPAAPALLLEAVYPDELADGYYAYHSLGGGGGAARSVELDAGQHCIQVCALQGDFHFDSITIEQSALLATPAPTAAPLPPPLEGDNEGSSSSSSGSNAGLSTGVIVESRAPAPPLPPSRCSPRRATRPQSSIRRRASPTRSTAVRKGAASFGSALRLRLA